jgi:hypothetical protein
MRNENEKLRTQKVFGIKILCALRGFDFDVLRLPF